MLYPDATASVSIDRHPPSAALGDLVRHYWIPRWSLPDGHSHDERILQYATFNLVIGADFAGLFGLDRGRGSRTLEGTGWAFGVMLQPGTAKLLCGDIATVRERGFQPMSISGWEELCRAVRAECAHDAAMITTFEAWLTSLALDPDESLLVNSIVAEVESDPTLTRADELADRFEVSLRTLQRLTADYIGINPKWLIQRRRLHDAAAALRDDPDTALASLATALGYADQAHFTRDFASVVGVTPAQYAAEVRPAT